MSAPRTAKPAANPEAAELEQLLKEIGWTRHALARRVMRAPQQIEAMIWGRRPVADWILDYARRSARALRKITPDFPETPHKGAEPVAPEISIQ